MSSVVECFLFSDTVCMHIDNGIDWLDPWNSRYWLQVQCRSFDSDKEQADVTKITDELRKLKANWSIFNL